MNSNDNSIRLNITMIITIVRSIVIGITLIAIMKIRKVVLFSLDEHRILGLRDAELELQRLNDLFEHLNGLTELDGAHGAALEAAVPAGAFT